MPAAVFRVGILRLRIRARFARAYASLRMTGFRSLIAALGFAFAGRAKAPVPTQAKSAGLHSRTAEGGCPHMGVSADQISGSEAEAGVHPYTSRLDFQNYWHD